MKTVFINKISMKKIVLACGLMLIPSVSVFAKQPLGSHKQLQSIANSMSAERIEKDITKLVSFGTRHSLSETESDTRGIGAARRWIFSEFEAISKACGNCLEVFYVSDFVDGKERIPNKTEIVNVIAIQKGVAKDNRFVMMSGDIDSRITDPLNGTDDSPGANDNASGVAGTLEAARVLSQYQFNGSIIYAALSGEEQGLFGGKILAAHALKNNWKIHAVLNNDMIGNIAGINGVIDNTSARIFSEGTRAVETPEEARIRRFSGGEVDSASRNLARYIDVIADKYIDNLNTLMIYRLDRFGRGGHHRPFNDVGFPAVRIMETNEHYDRQHQDLRNENGRHYGDTLEFVNFDYAAKLTALNAVSLASMAWAPAPPSGVEISGAVQADTQLKWEPSKDKTIKGYKIYWRYTDQPQWQFSREVGLVSEYTLKNIVIDNYYFGVAAVGVNGIESPIVFPGPAGRF